MTTASFAPGRSWGCGISGPGVLSVPKSSVADSDGLPRTEVAGQDRCDDDSEQ